MNTSVVKNSPSHVLSKTENRTVKKTLGRDRISISTTYVQLFITSPSEQDWLLLGTGALCITHDFQLNTFILVFMEGNKIVWECGLTSCSEYLCVSEKFHLLRVDQLMGVSFLCQLEAGHFQNKMHEITKYIKITSLENVTIRKNKNNKQLKKNNIKKSNTAPNLKKQKVKDSSIKSKISNLNKYIKKITKQNNSYKKFDNMSQSMPSSPIYDSTDEYRTNSVSSTGEEEHYQTLEKGRLNMMNFIYPCRA